MWCGGVASPQATTSSAAPVAPPPATTAAAELESGDRPGICSARNVVVVVVDVGLGPQLRIVAVVAVVCGCGWAAAAGGHRMNKPPYGVVPSPFWIIWNTWRKATKLGHRLGDDKPTTFSTANIGDGLKTNKTKTEG